MVEESLFRRLGLFGLGALMACAPAAPPPYASAPPKPAPILSTPHPTSAALPVPAPPSLPRPAKVSVQDKSLVGQDEKGNELFHGYFSLDNDALWFKSPDAARTFHLPLRRFPGARGSGKRSLAVSVDGVALVGADDGSLLAVDYEGKPRFQLGVRGAVTDIHARPQGGYEVITLAGGVILDPSQPSPVEPPLRPPAPIKYRVRPPVGGRAPDLVMGPNDAWSLEQRLFKPAVQVLHHFDGKAWTEVRMPELLERAHPIDPAKRSEFDATQLARGPKGQVFLVGMQQEWKSSEPDDRDAWLRVFEWDGRVFKERSDLAPAFRRTSIHEGSGTLYAAGPGDSEIVCFAASCLAHGLSPSFQFPVGKPRSAAPGVPGWVLFQGLDVSDHSIHSAIFAGSSLYRVDHIGFTRDGSKLVDLAMVRSDAGKKFPKPPDPYDSAYDEQADNQGGTQGLWASGPDDVWASVGYFGSRSVVFQWNGAKATHVPCSLPTVSSIGGSSRSDVWLVGEGVAHYDGHDVRRIPGIPPGRIVSSAAGDVWIGHFRVTPATSVLPDLQGAPASTPKIASPSLAVDVTRASNGLVVEPVTLKISGEASMSTAVQIQQSPGGAVWLQDRARVVEVEGESARVIHRDEQAYPLQCQRCLVPHTRGEGAILTGSRDSMVGLRAIAGGRPDDGVWWPALLAAARAPNGDLWAVSAAADSGVARAFVSSPSGVRNVAGLPMAAYADIAVRADKDVWFSGGLTTIHDGARVWPTGEGILVHFDGQAFTRYRGPEGALLSVAAVGPAEGWAVGYDGGIVHVKDGVVTAYHLERNGGIERVPLRAVAATGPEDVWIAGDRATLLRWDGRAFMRLEVANVGVDSALTGVVPPRDKASGWLAGPRGIWRIQWSKKTAEHHG